VARVARATTSGCKQGFVFRPSGNSDAHHHLVKFFWEMLPRNGGPFAARGLDIFVLRDDAASARCTFGEPLPPRERR